MDKVVFVHLQGGRNVSGNLRGYDLFLNLVLDDAREEPNIPMGPGSIVCVICHGSCFLTEPCQVIRGNNVTSMEIIADSNRTRAL